MGPSRGVLLAVLAALALAVAAIGFSVGREGDAPGAGAIAPPIARDTGGRAVEPAAEEIRLDLPGEGSGGREIAGVTVPRIRKDLAPMLEKRYRGFTPEQLAIAHERLCIRLRAQVDGLLREEFRSGAARPVEEEAAARDARAPGIAILSRKEMREDGTVGSRLAEIDVENHEQTTDLYQEIAWLAIRLPRKE